MHTTEPKVIIQVIKKMSCKTKRVSSFLIRLLVSSAAETNVKTISSARTIMSATSDSQANMVL
jgi:hypothetical protein